MGCEHYNKYADLYTVAYDALLEILAEFFCFFVKTIFVERTIMRVIFSLHFCLRGSFSQMVRAFSDLSFSMDR